MPQLQILKTTEGQSLSSVSLIPKPPVHQKLVGKTHMELPENVETKKYKSKGRGEKRVTQWWRKLTN